MRVLETKYGWNPIETAPFDKDVTLEVTDGWGTPHRRTACGWVSSSKGTPLAVTPVKWKPLPARFVETMTSRRAPRHAASISGGVRTDGGWERRP